MAKNIGTLITSTIRPNDSLDPIASAYGNEIKGGHHVYALVSERDSIIQERRDWGMLVTIYNDSTPSNNKTYQLKYNYVDTDIDNNLNWVDYSSLSSSNNKEWVDSVESIVNTPSSGIRYLVSNTGSGAFTGQNNKIAQYDSVLSSWTFSTPTEGMTLRVDDTKNVILKYQGTYSGGTWVREILNQVRYISPTSSNGASYSYTTIDQNLLYSYENVIIYSTFATANSGTVSLVVDGLSQIYVKKISGNTIVDLASGDINPSIAYQLIYNSGVLVTTINSNTNVIGPSEDGTYDDGLYTDFTTSTPIGTPIDRFNELFKYLVPPSAPLLSSWSATSSFVTGKLSFNSTTPGFSGATQSPYQPVDINDIFMVGTASGYRLGIMSKVNQPITGDQYYKDITGILNSNTFSYNSHPFPSYATYSFGDAITGTLSLYLNGNVVSSIGLTYSSVDTTSAGLTSGMNISSATTSKFSTGYEFDKYWNRTGTFTIKRNNGYIVDGYNYLTVRHDKIGTYSLLNRFEFIADGSTQSVTTSSMNITLGSNTKNKKLSGITFYDSMILRYSLSIQNLYKNTYSSELNAISFNDESIVGVNGVYGGSNTKSTLPIFTPTVPFKSISNTDSASNINKNESITSWTYSLNVNTRRINDSITFSCTVLRTVQGTYSGGYVGLTALFIDSYNANSTNIFEDFEDENYRLINFENKYVTSIINPYNDYTLGGIGNLWYSLYNNTDPSDSVPGGAPTGSLGGYKWISSESILNGTYTRNGLQVINSQLIYPKFDFYNAGNSTTNPNTIYSNTQYNNCYSVSYGFGTNSVASPTNYRTYTRYFNLGTASFYNKFDMIMQWSNCNFVNVDQPLISNNIWVEFKMPWDRNTGNPSPGTFSSYISGDPGALTGWLDATKGFIPGDFSDGDGCLDGSVPSSTSSTWGINFGAQSTYNSSGIVLMRITAGPSWNGYIDSIQIGV